MAEKRKTVTSTAVKKRYNDKTYQYYRVNLRRDTDAEIIKTIEANKAAGVSPTETIRKQFNK